MKRYVPYLNGSRDAAEPDSLYLWDAAARAGLTYRNYGEFVGTISSGDVEALNAGRSKRYPDTSATVVAFATKRSLEGHFNPAYRTSTSRPRTRSRQRATWRRAPPPRSIR